MSVKYFIKKHCPEVLLPVLRVPYRILRWPVRQIRKIRNWLRTRRIISCTLKYLPYYQDELSRKILFDRVEFLKTGDVNVFIDRAEKEGWSFFQLYGINGRSEYSYAIENREEYFDVLVIYDKEGRNMKYARKLMTMIYGADGFSCIELNEFLRCAKILKSSLIVPVIDGHIRPASIREDIQYFDVFNPVDNEIVVDAGAYDGATAIQFLEWGKGQVQKVYSFEFDPKNAEKCEENLKPYADKVTLVKKGTWDKDEVLNVKPSGTTGSRVSNEGNVAVSLTAIDNVVKDERVTFIKMDVEGAELKSLMGARNTIIKNHPRLAICVYHKASDLYEIPGYILSLVPEYKFYLRHYSSRDWETILYAYCD